jgi:hypothetical protein
MKHTNSNQIFVNSQNKNEFHSPFKILRQKDVKMRETEGDKRYYYCDKHIDFVVVTSFRSHIEPAHLQTENVESYFVIQAIPSPKND